MAAFQFRLKSLQSYREHKRNACRTLLAQCLAYEEDLQRQHEHLTNQRTAALAEFQELQSQQRLDITQAAARRFYASRLAGELRQLEVQRQKAAAQVQLCRQALIEADQSVKVLEQLSEKQAAEFHFVADQRESREREAIWQAGALVRTAATPRPPNE